MSLARARRWQGLGSFPTLIRYSLASFLSIDKKKQTANAAAAMSNTDPVDGIAHLYWIGLCQGIKAGSATSWEASIMDMSTSDGDVEMADASDETTKQNDSAKLPVIGCSQRELLFSCMKCMTSFTKRLERQR